MYCCPNTNNALFFNSVTSVPEHIWESLHCKSNLYFHKDFLIAIEKNHPEITFSYLVLLDRQKHAIAFASLQIVDFYIKGIKNELQSLIKKIEHLGQKLRLLPSKKPLKLLICGNTFVSGEHGVFIKKGQDKKQVIKKLAEAITHFSNSDKKLKADAYLLKDFVNESLFITNELKEYQYHPFLVEPNMVLSLQEDWSTFDDYLTAMKTKFRVKARKAFKQSAAIKIEEVTLKNITEQLPKMTELYQKVADNADFNLGHFNLKTYTDFKNKLGENYILRSYWLGDNIVGFLSGIINNNNSLDAHFVGIDYELNKQYAIYQRMLYDYIAIAINKKMKTLNFGRTASEIKSSVGAVPQDLTMYLRHKKTITNKILKVFLQRVEPTPFQQKFPFKKVEFVNEK
ncbi:GNAT family N-acetyltransferase [Polaribacter sp. WD7]|uniref:peptidogalycan biosysnthesis protein n=1 Tax=Polaribacter sp. WD7 TaxID=2269061 RepID=UPI000DF1C222|nr:peptidogalycan biosysnthesis protein [Polaribacter sp. WD7]RCS26219.1 GNAT family N-acetyltransferase [Polaribacter sp. WD7]